ncbi:MAG: PmoA family protein [Planctomycetota bacterium]
MLQPLSPSSSRWHPAALGLAALAFSTGVEAQSDPAPNTTLTAGGDGAVVDVDGDTFFALAEHRWSRPVIWPLHAPSGVPVTRSWPMQDEVEAERDHPHQRSLWFAHGDVDGVDFWTEGRGSGRVELDGRSRSTLDEHGRVVSTAQHRWVDSTGKLVCRDARTWTAHVDGAGRHLRLDVTLRALPERPLHLGDTKEGTFGLRLHPALRLEGKVATGHYLDAEGRTDRAVWGKRARWVAASGTVDGHAVGLVVMDHPRNLRHPTWWHARPYGLLAANPFGAHDFEGAPEGSGDHEVPAGQELALTYGVFLFEGVPDPEHIEKVWRAFADAAAESPDADGRTDAPRRRGGP